MASKRSHATSTDGQDEASVEQPVKKRSKNQSSSSKSGRQHQNSHIDPTWGQKYVFSSYGDATTTIPADSDVEFEDDADAMAYLKSVRQEATGIPHLLVAPKIPIGPQLPEGFRPPNGPDDDANEIADNSKEEELSDTALDRGLYESGIGDYCGRYEDGAYIGHPDSWVEEAEAQGGEDGQDWDGSPSHRNADTEAAVHEAYFASQLDHYHALRAVLRSKPPESVVSDLPRTHSPHVGRLGPRSPVFKIWNHRLRNTDPLPAQIASMDKESVLRVLRVLLSGSFLRRGAELHERTSRWVWALLARLPPPGELNHVEIAWVRDLGRRAVLLSQSLADMANLRDALDGEGVDLGVHEAVDDSSDDDEDVLQDMEVEEPEPEEDEGTVEEEDGDDQQENTGAISGEPDGIERRDETAAEPAVGAATATKDDTATAEDVEDGEIDEKGEEDRHSQSMDCSEDGEVVEDDTSAPHQAAPETDEGLEAAKARVLAQLEDVDVQPPAQDSRGTAAEEEEDEKAPDARLRARMNMRATLNMILTVAGEFYGQRDLLEFRDPFAGM
ncbi:hypothetical protein SODALDRAFT_316874 [Sodiomyces alkalinus F11]|uniref:Uncharacterized protein n=1 Tax=Sodiomyces alkalinus (strain CBS 110278 / VKM F-3762 / F11) TaxID=1314773 RepID=A0A3N2PLR5_SODAK|nr:hypothetical protein SODALDRAFT_316874 [Sodiomyces alkalinus F11]ROT35429.1 hypothetical protein SODALDRAFT_316874 [Sodiomyces alkalinus F11]